MPTTYKTDYEVEGIALLREAQRGQPRTEGLLRVGLRGVQRLEDALQQLTNPYDLSDATGDKLDQIGTVFGLGRMGLSDDAYRLLLTGKIVATRSNGLLSDVQRAAATIFQCARVYVYAPTSAGAGAHARGGSLGIMLGSPQLPSSLYALGRKLLPSCLPAGVSLSFLGIFNATKTIAFAGSQPYVGGFGSTADASKGAPVASLRATTPRT